MRGAGGCKEERRWRPAQALRVSLKKGFKMLLGVDKTCDVVSLERSFRPVLGGAPSPEEVEAAAHELLTIHSERSGTDDSLSLVCKDILCPQESPVPAVAQCLHLFRQNVHVQETVKSLAKDPAMWDAFVKNDKVQEWMQRQTPLPASAEFGFQERLNPLASAFDSMATVMREVLGAFLDLTYLLLKVVNRGISGERGTGTTMEQQPFKAVMLLTILILAVVLLHRLP